MVQNRRAYFIFQAVAIKWTQCVQENSEISNILQRSGLNSFKISGDFSLIQKRIMQQ